MQRGTEQRRAGAGRHVLGALRSILVPVDLSPASDRVLGRVALLPLDPTARIRLLHVVPGSLPARARRRAEHDAERTLADEATTLAKALPRSVTIATRVDAGAPAAQIAAQADAVGADLVVMGRGPGGVLRDAFLGSTAERSIRRSRRPVLVVRLRPRGPYRRPAAALDVDEAARDVLQSLRRVLAPARPRLTVLHAYAVPYQGLVYPSLSDEDAGEYREHYHEKAARNLGRLLRAALDGEEPAALRWDMRLRDGDPRIVVPKLVRKTEADLLALGTRGHTGIAQAFLGSVAGDLLRAAPCDVLVVPPRRSRARAG